MTRIVQYPHTGPADVLEVVEVLTPSPGAGEVLVEVKAVGLNPIEWKQRSGVRPAPGESPHRLGSDAAGVVSAVGEGVEGFAVGDRVVIDRAGGTYATDVVVAADSLTTLPASLSFEQGAALGIPVATAYQSLRSLGVEAGSTLLIHGGSGGVGQAAIQLAREWGATVLATASERNQDRLRELGAVPLVYGEGLVERVREAAPQGVDRILDAAGTDEALAASLELADDPLLQVATIVQGPRAAELGIQAYSGGSPVPLTDEQLAWRADAVRVVLDLVAQGRFDVEIASRYPLDRVADAHRESEAGHVRGKIVLLP